MTFEELKQAGFVEVSSCSICNKPLGYRVHPEYAAACFDSGCWCSGQSNFHIISLADLEKLEAPKADPASVAPATPPTDQVAVAAVVISSRDDVCIVRNETKEGLPLGANLYLAPAPPEGHVGVIEVEKLLLSKLGRDWTPDGISIRSLIDELASPTLDAMIKMKAIELCRAAGHDPFGPTADIYVEGDPDAGIPWAGYRAMARREIGLPA